MQPVNRNFDGDYTVNLIDNDNDNDADNVALPRAHESHDESDSDSFNMDGSRNSSNLPSKSRARKYDSSSDSDLEAPKSIKEVASSGDAKDTTKDLVTDTYTRLGLLTDKEIRQIKDPVLLQDLLIRQKSIVISSLSKAHKVEEDMKDLRTMTQSRQASDSAHLASQNVAINAQNRRDINQIDTGNWINTAHRIFSVAVTIILGIISFVCILV